MRIKQNLVINRERNFDLSLVYVDDLDFENQGTLSDNPVDDYLFSDNDPLLNGINIINPGISRTEEGFTLNLWIKKDFTPDILNEYFLIMGDTDTNGISFYYNDTQIGFKEEINRVTSSGDTVTRSVIQYVDLVEEYLNSYINLVIRFTRDIKLQICDEGLYPIPDTYLSIYDDSCEDTVPDNQKGELTFFVNGIRIFDTEIEEPIFQNLRVFLPDSFNGDISYISMYAYPLTVPEVKINYSTIIPTII